MVINWFTVVAQIINFLILVLLLKRFLYKPILRAMEDRQQWLEKSQLETQLAKTAAEEERKQLTLKNETFELERNEQQKMLLKAVEEQRKQMTEQARMDIEALRDRWKKNLEFEQETFRRNLSAMAQTELVALSQKILADLADSTLEERVVTAFLKRLRQPSSDEQEQLTSALRAATGIIQVQSGFELSPAIREDIIQALSPFQIGSDRFSFTIDPHVVCGIELLVGGIKISWTVSEYTRLFEKKLSLHLNQETNNHA